MNTFQGPPGPPGPRGPQGPGGTVVSFFVFFFSLYFLDGASITPVVQWGEICPFLLLFFFSE